MPVKDTSNLKTVSLVLTREQAEAIAERARRASTPLREVRVSEAAREVVEAGLAVLSAAPDMHKGTRTEDVERRA